MAHRPYLGGQGCFIVSQHKRIEFLPSRLQKGGKGAVTEPGQDQDKLSGKDLKANFYS